MMPSKLGLVCVYGVSRADERKKWLKVARFHDLVMELVIQIVLVNLIWEDCHNSEDFNPLAIMDKS